MENSVITGVTRLIVLLGDPVAHSISPQIHNHAFAHYKLPYTYVPLKTGKSDLRSVIKSLRACGFAGANVTIPHKQHVVDCCDKISLLSEKTGTVNTLYFKDDILCGTTTDSEGFIRALAEKRTDSAGSNCVILGNGGTARTLGYYLALERLPKTLTFVGRNLGRVTSLAEEISSTTGFETAATTFDSDTISEVLDSCSLLINCTSVGMYPNTGVSPLMSGFHRGMTVFDTIYNPAETELLKCAGKAGCKTQNGIEMLLHQGLASFKLWTGIDVDKNIFDMNELQSLTSGSGEK